MTENTDWHGCDGAARIFLPISVAIRFIRLDPWLLPTNCRRCRSIQCATIYNQDRRSSPWLLCGEKMNPADWLPEIVQRIVQASDPDKIVLFGSYAQDTASPDSDLDLLVVLSHADRLRQDSWRIRRALRGLLIPVDIVVATSEQVKRLGQTPGLIYRTVLQEGKVLYERAG